MEPRLNYSEVAPEGVEGLSNLEGYVRKSGLEHSLLELVKLRASQLNGCAYCIDMHTKDARTNGESEQRLYGVSAWHEAPFYSERERAALVWTEAVTLISQDHVPDEVYAEARKHFSEKELVDLTLGIIAINSWNRLAVSFRTLAGSYQPDHPAAKKGSSKQRIDLPPHTASFALEPAPPFRLDLTVWTLRRRLDNLFDRWDGKTYLRVLIEDDKPFEIAVMQLGESKSPQLRVALTGKTLTSKTKAFVTVALERLLGIKIDLQKFYRLSKKDQWLEPFVSQFQGMKPPRLLTPFEALVNAIACQQLTLTMGIRLLNRLTEAYGMALKTEAGIVHAFPRPQDLANADIEDLRKMGFSYQKARYLTNISRFIVDGELNLDTIAQLDDKEAVARLCELKGVGRWTAEYVLLRGLGRTHIFPADDVGARNNLQRWLDLSGTMTYDNTREALSRWDGYGGLVYFHLLLKSLTEKGWIGGGYVEDQARV